MMSLRAACLLITLSLTSAVSAAEAASRSTTAYKALDENSQAVVIEASTRMPDLLGACQQGLVHVSIEVDEAAKELVRREVLRKPQPWRMRAMEFYIVQCEELLRAAQ